MRNKIILAFLLVASSGTVMAEVRPCEEAYRSAYLGDAATSWDPQGVADAQRIYEIYFDYTQGLGSAYSQAHVLFEALGTDQSQQQEVLQALKWHMRYGTLCKSNGDTLTIPEVIELLRHRMQ